MPLLISLPWNRFDLNGFAYFFWYDVELNDNGVGAQGVHNARKLPFVSADGRRNNFKFKNK